MTPVTLRIDRTFKGVGRIAVFTGTTEPKVRKRMSKMLTELYENGRLDILHAIRSGDVTMLEVLSAYQRKQLDKLPTGDTAQLLSVAFHRWLSALRIPTDASKHHVDQLRTTLRYFDRINPKARVAELPAVLEKLRNKLGLEHPRSFNLARSGALAFVRQTLKKSHPLWLAVSAVEMRKVPKSDKRRPLTPQMMKNLFPNPETDHVDAIAWGMATTGMGNKEYFGRWEVLSDRIHVYGTKRVGRDRDIPLVSIPAVPRMHHRTFENKVRERTTLVTPYDFRRTFAHWMESAGVPRTRRRLYMGHGAGDVTGLYELHEVTAFLAEDAAKIRGFLGLPHTVSHTFALVKDGSA